MMFFSKGNVPVLMYHALIDRAYPEVHPVHVLKSEFAKHMKWLYEHGYRTCSLVQLYDFLTGKRKGRSNMVVITFDDGYHSLYSFAMPILKQYGFTAVLFLTTAAVGEASYHCLPHCESYPANDRPLTWEEIREMQRSGWEIQAHGHRHYDHTRLDETELEAEIHLSREAINQHLQANSEFYCYPYGCYNEQVLNKISEMGFKAAFSVWPGFANSYDDLRSIRRVNVMVRDDLCLFKKKLRNGYGTRREMFDWKIREMRKRFL